MTKEPTQTHQVWFPADLAELPALRAFIAKICAEAPGNPMRLTTDLQLAINEAFSNSVKHSYKMEKGNVIGVHWLYLHEGILFDICDKGSSFDLEKIGQPNLSELRESGYGLFLIRQLVDHLFYYKKESHEGWNRLRFFKRYYLEETMNLEHHVEENTLTVIPKFDSLDAKNAQGFKEQLLKLIYSIDAKTVVVDLHNVQFIDSSGLGCFLSILTTMHGKNGELKLIHLNEPVRAIFEVVSMHKIFEIEPTHHE